MLQVHEDPWLLGRIKIYEIDQQLFGAIFFRQAFIDPHDLALVTKALGMQASKSSPIRG